MLSDACNDTPFEAAKPRAAGCAFLAGVRRKVAVGLVAGALLTGGAGFATSGLASAAATSTQASVAAAWTGSYCTPQVGNSWACMKFNLSGSTVTDFAVYLCTTGGSVNSTLTQVDNTQAGHYYVYW